MAPRPVRRALGAARRATPPAVVPLIVRARQRTALADPQMWERAREEMRFLLERSRPDADVEEAARRYIERWVWRSELRWRSRMITRQPVEGLERLVAARDRGRGVVLNFMHHGQYAFVSLARAGVSCHIVVHPNMLTDEAPETLRQHFRVGSPGSTVLTTEVGLKGMIEVVAGGAVLAVASDSPGSSQVTFAGRQVKGSSGAARIAMATGAPVVLLTAHPGAPPYGSRLRLSEPLEPSGFADAEELLAEMVRRHEDAVLAWPEAADSPLSRWNHDV
jgi:lauroyl/myristoyl acyltransferase